MNDYITTNTQDTESIESTELDTVESTEAAEVTESSEATESTEALENTETTEIVGVETFPPENNQVDNMVYTLPMMGKGMLGIFLVTIIIVASVAILNKVTGNKK